MLYRALADVVVGLHLAFVLFVVLGVLLVVRWPWVAWVHVPCALWGTLIELAGWVCPLTPLENRLRTLGSEAGYRTGFIEHYVLSALYPAGLTRGIQLALGFGALGINLALYGWLWRRTTRADRSQDGADPG
jgi:hypothetical protein